MIGEKISVLKIINTNKDLSQRKISKELGVSLGKINSILKELAEEDFISINYLKNKVEYNLTNLGVEYLTNKISDFKNLKVNIHEQLENKDIKEAVILAAGVRSDFDRPVSFLELDNISILDRMIEILKDNGIEKFIIVTGDKKEFFDHFEKKYKNVTCIYNENYKWTGSMASLALTKDEISGDFLLIENDLVFESNAIERILKNSKRDCILITNESGSGDEAFVEIRNNHIFKMSKDIHQMNKVDGEMIGISKISKKLFNLMISEFSTSLNPYMNYEYTLLDVARNYEVGYEKFIDLVWGEVDNTQQYKKVLNYIIPRIRRKELTDKVGEVREILEKALSSTSNNITNIAPIGGMTNKNYSGVVNGKGYVVRIPGKGTSDMIDRFSEGINSSLVAKAGIDANIIYYDDLTGTKVSEMIEGAETINAAMAKREENMKLTTDVLRNLHNSEILMKNRFDVFENIELYEELVEKVDGVYYDGYFDIREDILEIKNILIENNLVLVPCHNDTVPENFIKDSNGKVYLIDWEYGGINDPMWDLAAHSIECEFTKKEEELFLKMYFKGNVKDYDRIRVLCYKILQDFLWSIWTIIKEAKGDNFGTYGIDRFNRCKILLDELKQIYIYS